MCGINTRAGSSFSKGLSTDNSISRLILSNNLLYNLYSFFIRVSAFRKKFLAKDSMCGVENDIFLYIAYKVIITIEN